MTPRKPPPLTTEFPAMCGPVTRRAVTLIMERPGISGPALAADLYRDRRLAPRVHVLMRYIRQTALPAGVRIVGSCGNRGGYRIEGLP